MNTAGVIIPTYRRPTNLRRCVEGLAAQAVKPVDVVVVVRHSDVETLAFLESWSLPLGRVVMVEEGGVVAAMNRGIEVVEGGCIAFTDDDAVPRPDWIERILVHFARDPRIGAIGGRDWIWRDGTLLDGAASDVGRIQWFGRVIGNHHVGVGPAREVDLLKGVNMTFRREALEGLRADRRFLGGGAQVHCDAALSLAVRRRGWKVVYDPCVAVDHYHGLRFGTDHRERPDQDAVVAAVVNETLMLLEHLPPVRRLAFILWSLALGTRVYPGLFMMPLRLRTTRTAQIRTILRARLLGVRLWVDSTRQRKPDEGRLAEMAKAVRTATEATAIQPTAPSPGEPPVR